LNHLALRLTPVLPQRFEREQLRLDALGERMRVRGESLLDSPEQKLINAASRLHDLSPLAVIGRGYSMVRDSAGSVVRSVEAVQTGDVVKVDLSDGCLDCRVEAISEKAQTCDK
jgi:exodeoxyribonuclease VII large subunit